MSLLVYLILLFGSAVIFGAPFTSYFVHICMIKEDKCKYGYANFDRFLDEYNRCIEMVGKLKIEGKSIFKNGNFDRELIYIHANIIRFEEKGMILYPVDWFKFKKWLRKQTNNRKVKDLWK